MSAARRVLLQAGFGVGHAFLQAWQGWRDNPLRAARLDYIAITQAPPEAEALRRAHRGTALAALAEVLAASWPPRTRNLHRLGFDGGRVHLLLAPGHAADLLPQLRAEVDEFLIDEAVLPADPRFAAPRLGKGLARLAAPGARLRAAASPPLRAALQSAGFELENDAGEIRAVYRPAFVPRRPGPSAPAPAQRHALIVGAGLAGCATAAALAEQGWRCTLLDRASAPAQEASGNPAGLFHGVVHPQDGVHARFNRAAALQAQRTVAQAIADGLAQGSARGLLRLESSGKPVAAMRAALDALQLPADYVQALDAAEAGARCGLPLQHPAWFYPGGGWVQPAGLARACLQRAGTACEFRGGLQVQSLRASGGGWQLLAADGGLIAESGTVVLANAFDALRLLGANHWPVQAVRGQLSLCAASLLRLPRLPLAGAGYLLPEVDGLAVFGASAQPGDEDAAVRDADHAFNLERLARLGPQPLPAPGQLQGRTAWRCVAADRLPLVGAVPDESAPALAGRERLREVPRRAGLYVFSALGSRGIAWSELGAQVLAARITAAPVPLEAALVEALDPARFALRAARRSGLRG